LQLAYAPESHLIAVFQASDTDSQRAEDPTGF